MLHDGTYMTDDEFLFNFWMDRACILQLSRLVENDKVFYQLLRKEKQAAVDVAHHGVSQVLRELWEWSIFWED